MKMANLDYIYDFMFTNPKDDKGAYLFTKSEDDISVRIVMGYLSFRDIFMSFSSPNWNEILFYWFLIG